MIIDGRAIAGRRLEILRNKIQETKIKPKLAIVLVGNDPASRIYVNLKVKKAKELEIETEVLEFPADTTDSQLISRIQDLNNDKTIHGIIVQLPLPAHLQETSSLEGGEGRILEVISKEKDVDGLTGKGPFLPATVRGILTILDEIQDSGFKIQGKIKDNGNEIKDRKWEPGKWLKNKTMTIVGQGRLVGKPLSDYLEKNNYEVIRCDEFTTDLKSETLKGDVLVVATGQKRLITADMVKSGAIVIDCGSPKAEVDFENVSKVAGWITPVPGGVGPMTVVSLLENLVWACVGV